MSDLLKKMSNSLIFGVQLEQFAHIAHQKKGMSESFFFNLQKTYKNVQKNMILVKKNCKLLVFCEQKRNECFASKTRDLLICSFIMSDLSESLIVTHLS